MLLQLNKTCETSHERQLDPCPWLRKRHQSTYSRIEKTDRELKASSKELPSSGANTRTQTFIQLRKLKQKIRPWGIQEAWIHILFFGKPSITRRTRKTNQRRLLLQDPFLHDNLCSIKELVVMINHASQHIPTAYHACRFYK